LLSGKVQTRKEKTNNSEPQKQFIVLTKKTEVRFWLSEVVRA